MSSRSDGVHGKWGFTHETCLVCTHCQTVYKIINEAPTSKGKGINYLRDK